MAEEKYERRTVTKLLLGKIYNNLESVDIAGIIAELLTLTERHAQ